MPGPRRHHFVPQMLLRRFADADGLLYFFDRQFPELGVRRSKPGSIFTENHLYSIKNSDGSKNTAVETWLSKYEGVANGIIDHFIECADQGVVPNLSVTAKRVWDEFLFIQWKRVPESLNTSDSEMEKHLADALAALEAKRGPLTEEQRATLLDPAFKKRAFHNGRIQAIARDSFGAVDALAGRAVGLGVVRDPKKSLVVGSRAVTKLTVGTHTHLTDPVVEIWLPVSSKLAVGISPDSRPRSVELKAEDVRYLNRATADHSRFFAGGAEPLVRSLARPR